MGVCNCSMFCCTLLYVHSSIAIILMGKRELVALLNLSSWCLVMLEWLFLAVPWGCLRFVIVVFPDQTHLRFLAHTFITILLPSSKIFFTDLSKRCFFCGFFLLLTFRVCNIVMSVHCSLVVTCRERASLLALLYLMFSCVFVTFPCGALGKVRYLIMSIPDIYILPYFVTGEMIYVEF